MPPPAPPQPDLDRARLFYWSWFLATMFLLGGLIYIPVIGDGLRELVPTLGKRSMVGFDAAKVLAVFMMLAVWILWEYAIMAYLKIEVAFNVSGIDREAFKKFVVTLSSVVLFCDAALFYIAMTKLGWRGGTFSFTALLATAVWVAVLVFVSFVSVQLKKPLLEDRR